MKLICVLVMTTTTTIRSFLLTRRKLRLKFDLHVLTMTTTDIQTFLSTRVKFSF